MNKNSQRRAQDLETVAVLAAACLLFYWLSSKKFLLPLAFMLLAGSVLSEKFAFKVSESWLKFGKFIGGISNRVILALVFYLLLTPIALAYRLFHKNPLCLRRGDGDSCYRIREHSFSARDLRDPW